MDDTKKQAWDKETVRPPKDWSMPADLGPAKKRNTDLRPYARLVQHQFNDVHERQAGTEDHECDLEYEDAHHHYLLHFQENLEYIRPWKQYAMLELLIQGVDLGKVTIPWLRQFREDLDLKV